MSASPCPLAELSPGPWIGAPSILTKQINGGESAIYGFADVDGDGFPDYTALNEEVVPNQTIAAFSILSPDGQLQLAWSTVQLPLGEIDVGDLATYYFDDVNGDGLVDFVEGGCIGGGCSFSGIIGAGDGTFRGQETWQIPDQFAQEIINGPAFAYLHDVNGDGLADLVVSDQAGIWVSLSEGVLVLGSGPFAPANGVLSASPIFIPPPSGVSSWPGGDTLRFADLDASGVDDIVVTIFEAQDDCTTGASVAGVCIAGAGFNGEFQNAYMANMDLLGGASIPLLARVDNGIGSVTTLSYDMTAHLSSIATNAGGLWANQTPQNVHVVTNVTTTLAGASFAGGPYTTTYEYANPVYDKRFREFRGFDLERTTQIDGSTPANDMVTETSYLTQASLPASTPDFRGTR